MFPAPNSGSSLDKSLIYIKDVKRWNKTVSGSHVYFMNYKLTLCFSFKELHN